MISRCRVGDAVVKLGTDCAAAGSRIVVEAKQFGAYSLRSTQEECDTARKNREAGISLFAHSRRTAPIGMEPLARHGLEIVVVWDANDEGSDTFLKAGWMIAKALAVRSRRESDAQAHDPKAIESCIVEIVRQANQVEEITTSTSTIRSNAEKVLAKAEKVRNQGLAQAELLADQVRRLES